jgi:YD repeat-containing protein
MARYLPDYDASSDQLYIYVDRSARPEGVVARTVELDEFRRLDYDAEGRLLGIEIDTPRRLGLDLEGIPEPGKVRAALETLAAEYGWPVAPARQAG